MISRVDLYYKYPYLFEWIGITGFECQDGWMDLIDELAGKIVSIRPDAQVAQLKEKFGELRVYMTESFNEVNDIIDWYSKKSLRTCEICGHHGELIVHKGLWQTRCEEHKPKEEK